MTKSIRAVTALTAFILLAGSDSARAQLIDQMMSSSIGAGTELNAAARPKASPETIMKNLQAQGFSNITPAASSATQSNYTATALGGMKMAITVDPLTGKIISATPQQ